MPIWEKVCVATKCDKDTRVRLTPKSKRILNELKHDYALNGTLVSLANDLIRLGDQSYRANFKLLTIKR